MTRQETLAPWFRLADMINKLDKLVFSRSQFPVRIKIYEKKDKTGDPKNNPHDFISFALYRCYWKKDSAGRLISVEEQYIVNKDGLERFMAAGHEFSDNYLLALAAHEVRHRYQALFYLYQSRTLWNVCRAALLLGWSKRGQFWRSVAFCRRLIKGYRYFNRKELRKQHERDAYLTQLICFISSNALFDNDGQPIFEPVVRLITDQCNVFFVESN
jgi:hypothetical protein